MALKKTILSRARSPAKKRPSQRKAKRRGARGEARRHGGKSRSTPSRATEPPPSGPRRRPAQTGSATKDLSTSSAAAKKYSTGASILRKLLDQAEAASLTLVGEAKLYVPAEDAVIVDRKLREDDGLCSIPLSFGVDPRPFPIYPYSQGPDIANDGIAYGEEIRVKVYRVPRDVPSNGASDSPPKGSLKSVPLEAAIGCHRRTRSGRQFESNENAPGKG